VPVFCCTLAHISHRVCCNWKRNNKMRLVEVDKDAFHRICMFSLGASPGHNILPTLSRPKLYSWVKSSEKYRFMHSSRTPLSLRFPGHEVNVLILVLLWFCHACYWFYAPVSVSEVIAMVCHYCRSHWKHPTLTTLQDFITTLASRVLWKIGVPLVWYCLRAWVVNLLVENHSECSWWFSFFLDSSVGIVTK
jgi:hypothetical protein